MAQTEYHLRLDIRPYIGWPLLIAALLTELWFPWLSWKLVNLALRTEVR